MYVDDHKLAQTRSLSDLYKNTTCDLRINVDFKSNKKETILYWLITTKKLKFLRLCIHIISIS